MTTSTPVSVPNYLSPMNNIWGNIFILNNASTTELNFRYVTKLYVNNVYTVQESFPPRPVTGYGNYSPYGSVLPSITYDLGNQTATTFLYATNSLANYKIVYGERWNPDLDLQSVLFLVTGTFSTQPIWGFSFSTAHGFTASDIITIQTQNPYFGGTSSVLSSSLTNNTFYINKVYTDSSLVASGTITDAIRFDGTSSTYWGYNGTRQYDSANTNYNNLVFGRNVAATPQFLTNYINTVPTLNSLFSYGKSIGTSQYETLGAFVLPGVYQMIVSTYNTSNVFNSTISKTFSITGINATMSRVDFAVGTANLSQAPFSVNWTGIGSYYITLAYVSTSTTYLNQRGFIIDPSCSLYTNVRLMFLNRWGSFDYFNFKLDDKKTYQITRNNYKKELSWNYSIGDRETTILSQQVKETHNITSDWIDEDDYTFVAELVTSPEVYVINETTGVATPIVITDNSYEFKTANRDQIFNVKISYEMSSMINTQNQ